MADTALTAQHDIQVGYQSHITALLFKFQQLLFGDRLVAVTVLELVAAYTELNIQVQRRRLAKIQTAGGKDRDEILVWNATPVRRAVQRKQDRSREPQQPLMTYAPGWDTAKLVEALVKPVTDAFGQP